MALKDQDCPPLVVQCGEQQVPEQSHHIGPDLVPKRILTDEEGPKRAFLSQEMGWTLLIGACERLEPQQRECDSVVLKLHMTEMTHTRDCGRP